MFPRTPPLVHRRMDFVAQCLPWTRGLLVVVAMSIIANASSSFGQADGKPSDQPANPADSALGKPAEKTDDEAVKKIRLAVKARLDDASDLFGDPRDYRGFLERLNKVLESDLKAASGIDSNAADAVSQWRQKVKADADHLLATPDQRLRYAKFINNLKDLGDVYDPTKLSDIKRLLGIVKDEAASQLLALSAAEPMAATIVPPATAKRLDFASKVYPELSRLGVTKFDHTFGKTCAKLAARLNEIANWATDTSETAASYRRRAFDDLTRIIEDVDGTEARKRWDGALAEFAARLMANTEFKADEIESWREAFRTLAAGLTQAKTDDSDFIKGLAKRSSSDDAEDGAGGFMSSSSNGGGASLAEVRHERKMTHIYRTHERRSYRIQRTQSRR